MGAIVSALSDTAPEIPPLENPKSDEPCALLVNGVCDAWSQPHFSQFLTRSNIPFTRVVKVRGEEFAIMEFKSNKDRQLAYNFLSGCQLTDQKFEVRPFHGYDPPPMPYATQAEIMKFSSLKTQSIYDRLYPLAEKDPSERLAIKLDTARQFLKDVISPDYKINIIPCPENYESHTTIELTVGYDEAGEIAVGFNNSSRTYVTIVPMDSSYDFPPQVQTIAQQFTHFVKRSPFPPYDNNSATGKWRTILIRLSSTGETMLVIVTYGGLPLSEIQRLETHFQGKVTSVYWAKSDQTHYDASTPNRVLMGTPSINEKIVCKVSPHFPVKGEKLGDKSGAIKSQKSTDKILENSNEILNDSDDIVYEYKFSIHPFNPFPGNLTMFSLMIQKVAHLAEIDSHTVVVDVACGVGFDCICLASYAKRIVGFDPDEHMINGSLKNTENNEIKNAFFIKETAEKGLIDVTNNLTGDEKIVCILNTMNPAPYVSSIKAISLCTRVKKFVYITDSLYTFAYDCQRLLLEGNKTGAPPFMLSDIELFDFKPKSQISRIVGLFTRD
ncbi:hypothetical protein TRFO_30898 [Tritrichomonas foetus]|uniref:Methyltransferase domain-containing protein n=1 Tax=Tritrichomonas foetus TaxID=1144522 RepID=A0A1J4JUI1_9EUKA|nr:hypothetical protein TRFO_30898 [Tritrichomonas foetus]|eukprot:OHT02136.1 hypothetical protein TRFO_30898 [Tritrichomonas foetus]